MMGPGNHGTGSWAHVGKFGYMLLVCSHCYFRVLCFPVGGSEVNAGVGILWGGVDEGWVG